MQKTPLNIFFMCLLRSHSRVMPKIVQKPQVPKMSDEEWLGNTTPPGEETNAAEPAEADEVKKPNLTERSNTGAYNTD